MLLNFTKMNFFSFYEKRSEA